MCRNITTLRGLEPSATPQEIEAAARQYVRKVSGVQSTSPKTEDAFERAVRLVTAATAELLALLDSRQPGHLAPMLTAERELVRVRLASADSTADAAAAFAAAVSTVRELSTPYHLAHGLLDHAAFLLGQGDADAAALTTDEARDIADRLGCQPLLARAADTVSAEPRAPA